MTGLEIGLLVIGVMAFVLGGMLPVSGKKEGEQGLSIPKEEIKEMIAGQLTDAKNRMEEMAEETTGYAVEKAERAMERLTNEKITAVTEYAETVLSDINKNHQEVMFLYNMLNEKHDSFMESVKKADRMMSERKEKKTVEAATSGMERLKRQAEEAAGRTALRETAEGQKKEPQKAKSAPKTEKRAEPGKKKPVGTEAGSGKKELLFGQQQFPVQFPDRQEDGDLRNNNEKILALYKEGKSNMMIAKELGLGVGEVKLVIDLFKGMSS